MEGAGILSGRLSHGYLIFFYFRFRLFGSVCRQLLPAFDPSLLIPSHCYQLPAVVLSHHDFQLFLRIRCLLSFFLFSVLSTARRLWPLGINFLPLLSTACRAFVYHRDFHLSPVSCLQSFCLIFTNSILFFCPLCAVNCAPSFGITIYFLFLLSIASCLFV